MKRTLNQKEENEEKKQKKQVESSEEDEEDSDFNEEEDEVSEEEVEQTKIQLKYKNQAPVYIKNPKFDELEDKDEIIIPKKNISILFAYPLHNKVNFTFDTDSEGFSREDILQLISESYEEIYKTENETSKIKEGTLEGTKNRNGTNGKYSIYGHFLENLILHEISVEDRDDVAHLFLDVSI